MGAAGVGRESRAQGRIELRSLLFVFRLRPTGHGGLRGGCDGRISARGQALGAGEAVGVAEARQQAQLAHLHGGRSFFERGKNHADAFGRLRRTLGDCDERALGAREIFFVGLLPGPLQNGGLLGDGCDVGQQVEGRGAHGGFAVFAQLIRQRDRLEPIQQGQALGFGVAGGRVVEKLKADPVGLAR